MLQRFEQEQHEYHVLSYVDGDIEAVLGTCLSDTGTRDCLNRVFDYLDHQHKGVLPVLPARPSALLLKGPGEGEDWWHMPSPRQ